MTIIRDAVETLLLDLAADFTIAVICAVGAMAIACDKLEEYFFSAEVEWR